MQLPGFYRPTKKWDVVVVHNKTLLVALEMKSQVGPSFGNNFNNRTEEAVGSAVDIWTAYREGAFSSSIRPWLGYLFVVEESPRSLSPVRVEEPHFAVFPEFVNASYCKRYELFCRKLVLERQYNAAALVTSNRVEGPHGGYKEPADDLRFDHFARSLKAHLTAYAS